MPDPALQAELVRRAQARDAAQSIGPQDPRTTAVAPDREDPFSTPDWLHSVLNSISDPSNFVPGGAGGAAALPATRYLEQKAIEEAPAIAEKAGPGLQYFGTRGKALMDQLRTQVPTNGVSEGFAEQLRMADRAKHGVPFGSPQYGPMVTAMPKPGGVLYDVLERAGARNAVGHPMTPGEQRLWQHYTSLIR